MSTNNQRPLNWFNNVESRPHPWPGLNWLTTMIYVPDVKLATNVYEDVFGFVPIFEMPHPDDEKINIFARLRYRGINFTLNKEGAFGFPGKSPLSSGIKPPFSFYMYVDNIYFFLEIAKIHNFEITALPYEEKWGDILFKATDPFGYMWDIAHKIQNHE